MFYKKSKDLNFWKTVRNDDRYSFLIDKMKDMYEKFGHGELTDISYDTFMKYHRTGNRKDFERQYFARRIRLTACTLLSLIYPDNEEYFSNLNNTIWAICNEYCWSLPCHTKASNDIFDDSYLDLFACETGQALSEIRHLFGPRLESLMHERIHNEIQHRIIDSFLTRSFTFERNPQNWGPVCGGCVGMTFMLERPDLFDHIKHRIAPIMRNYINGYKNDGVCLEGLEYWEYGFGYFCFYGQALLEYTNGKENLFTNVFDEEMSKKIKKIASVPSSSFLSGNAIVAFADCGRYCSLDLGRASFIEHYFDVDFPHFSKEFYTICDHTGKFATTTRAFVYFDPNNSAESVNENKTYFFKESGWFVSKTEDYGFATKAGHNGEPHNHNDVGTFIIAKNGHPVLCDIGRGEYTADYFNKNRYTILCNRSIGHSVPIIDSFEQQAGENFRGTINFDNNTVFMDLTNAYPPCRVSKLTRQFDFAGNSIILKDSFEYTENCPVVERFITMIEPEQKDGCVLINDTCIEYPDNWTCKISSQPHSVHALESYATEAVYIIDFIPKKEGNADFTLTINI